MNKKLEIYFKGVFTIKEQLEVLDVLKYKTFGVWKVFKKDNRICINGVLQNV